MTTITLRYNDALFQTKPGTRYTIVRDLERKERELTKYLNTCQLYKQVNPECKPKRSELIENMYEEKKVMTSKTCRRTGAKAYNFKKQSASRVISNNKVAHKGSKLEFGIKSNKRSIQNYHLEESDYE